jgi:hypothetical protein
MQKSLNLSGFALRNSASGSRLRKLRRGTRPSPRKLSGASVGAESVMFLFGYGKASSDPRGRGSTGATFAQGL